MLNGRQDSRWERQGTDARVSNRCLWTSQEEEHQRQSKGQTGLAGGHFSLKLVLGCGRSFPNHWTPAVAERMQASPSLIKDKDLYIAVRSNY